MAAVEVFPPPDDENPPKWWLISRSNFRSYLSWPKCVTSLYRSAKTESNDTPHAPNAPLRWWCVGPRAFNRWCLCFFLVGVGLIGGYIGDLEERGSQSDLCRRRVTYTRHPSGRFLTVWFDSLISVFLFFLCCYLSWSRGFRQREIRVRVWGRSQEFLGRGRLGLGFRVLLRVRVLGLGFVSIPFPFFFLFEGF